MSWSLAMKGSKAIYEEEQMEFKISIGFD